MGNMKISTRRWFANLVFLLISSGFHWQFADAFTDTILQGQSITTSQTIVSAGGVFELGFFSPGKSTKYYVGIWYKEVSEQTIVWVANRDYSFTNPSVVLTVSTDGNLEILEGKFSYKLTSISSNSNTSATLLDSGNLVLRNDNSNILWESFDYPSDTLLPGMKLGYDKRAGKTWSLVSWKSIEDPGLGAFSLKHNPNGSGQSFDLYGPESYWTGGMWDGQIFSQVPEMRFFYMYKYRVSFSENESHLSFYLHNSSILSRTVLHVSGQLRQLNWNEETHQWDLFGLKPETQCDVYAYCGPFGTCTQDSVEFCECLPGFEPRFPQDWKLQDRSGGCVRKADLQCVNGSHASGERDQFLRVSNVRLPKYPIKLQARSAMECESACLNHCSCSAYAYDREECRIWGEDLLNVEQLSDDDSNGRTFYIRLAASELNRRVLSSKWKVWLIVTLAISVTSAFVIYGILRRLQRKGEDLLLFGFSNSSEDTSYELSETNRLWRGEKKEVDLPMFSFSSVSAATNNFSIENKLGEGGFGPVYKGKSQKGYEVAVKRLSKRSGQGWEELRNEAMLIANLQHKNLVKVLGCCIEQDEKILIYEYMPNKSLDFFLFDPAKHGILNWETRVHIIEGVAQGLLYLHHYSRLRIIHRDLKASNILLDKDMNPKISDFGMARIFGGNESKATKHIVGTYGYMSPEYALRGLFSTKSDVFSFGVLLLEILSGKKSTGFYHCDCLSLLGYAWDLWKNNRGQDFIDPVLDRKSSTHILLRYINVGLLCVQESADDRPTMSDVVSMLGNENVLLPSPNEPAFSNLRGVKPHASQDRPQICSLNEGKSQKGYEVAVKRLSKRSGQGWEELKNEAMLIAKLQHKNLVKLLGCCIEQDEKILIYEYMSNKSLDFFLSDPAKHGILNWETRVHIIEGVAQGLLYLHHYSRLRIIHRDLKASNILLDKDMNPKISDFGMARIFGDDESKATNHIVGTYGYMSPEYALEGLFSTKSDVFSFGVLLLEILSGKKNTGFYQSDSLNLLGYAWDLWKDSRGQELMDPVLEETLPTHILLKYINIGLLCVQDHADDRPTMSDIVSMLGNESVRLPSPKQPAFSNLRSGVEPHISQNRPAFCSLNGVTLTIMEAR